MKFKISLAFLLLTFHLSLLTFPALAEEQENISVSATVPPRSSDFQFSFSSPEEGKHVEPGTGLWYKIIYGARSSASFNTNTKLTIDWSTATAPDGSTIADYVTGTASNAYGGTPPVIDLVNKKVTWTISSLPPGQIDQIVTMGLKINNNYLKSNTLHDFSVRARMNNQYVSMPDQPIGYTYKYQYSFGSTSTSTTTSTSVPTPTTPPPTTQTRTSITTNTTTTTQTTTIAPTDIALREISQSTVKIAMLDFDLGNFVFKYGKTPTDLSETVIIAHDTPLENINLAGLAADTAYYFQLTPEDGDKKAASDVFTFKTAQASQPLNFENNVSVITSNGTVLASDVGKAANTPPTALLSQNSNFEVTYTLKNKVDLKSIEAVVRNKVLGTNTFSQVLGANEIVVPMKEKAPDMYIANLKSFTLGNYEILVRISDVKGNLKEQKIAEAKVMPHLSVYDEATKQPITDARVYLYHYNSKSNKYEPITPDIFVGLQNPLYTNKKGEISVVLPQGKYNATASTLEYDEQSVEFVLGPNPGEEFPRIFLKKNPANILNFINYYIHSAHDLINNFFRFVDLLSSSHRFFNMLAVIVVTAFVLLSFLLFAMRTHIAFTHTPDYFMHHLNSLLRKHKQEYAFGTVLDENGQGLSLARVEVIDNQTKKTLTHLTTNKNGSFYIHNTFGANAVVLKVSREGYVAQDNTVILNCGPDACAMIRMVMKHDAPPPSIMGKIIRTIEHVLGLSFEFVLIFSLILELFFFSLFGFAKTLPFFTLSLLNILLWIFFLKEKRELSRQ